MTAFICWSLNRATDTVERYWPEMQTIFAQAGKSLEEGNNTSFYYWPTRQQHLKAYPEHQLMLDGPPEDPEGPREYFAPIALKCLGNTNNHMDPLFGLADNTQLQAIKAANAPFQMTSEQLNPYWAHDTQISPLQQMRMRTSLMRGYYHLLYDYLQRPPHQGKKHILIGYSQGGLVARFLMYLDKYVFRQHIIAGVITMGAPNWGSPLANPTNTHQLNTQLVQLQAQFLSWLPQHADFLSRWLGQAFPPTAALQSVTVLVNYLDQQLQQHADEQSLPKERFRLFIGMRKWLSGLVPLGQAQPLPTAFNDLSFLNFDRPASVLSLVNQHDPFDATHNTGYHGAVINTGEPLLHSLSNFLQQTGRQGAETTPLDQLLANIMQESEQSAAAFSQPAYYAKATQALQHLAQELQLQTSQHDFVVPASYQALPTHSAGFLDNQLVAAHHGNGMHKGWPALKQLLQELAAKV